VGKKRERYKAKTAANNKKLIEKGNNIIVRESKA
jgi:hypothetical protein